MLVPRPYQRQTQVKIIKYMAEAGAEIEDVLVAWPTGTGKAFGIAITIHELVTKHPGMRIMVTCPSMELVEQNYEELKAYWPLAPAGIYCGGLDRYDTQYPITFGTMDSIEPAIKKFGRIDMLMPDECHRLSPKEESRYGRLSSYLKSINKYFFAVGWTATDYRMGYGRLTDEGGLFKKLIYDATTFEAYNWFFDEGYLIRPISAPTNIHVAEQKIGMSGGDYKQGELQEAFDKDAQDGIIYQALQEAVAVAREEGRHTWICFVPGKKACEDTVEMLEAMGVTATFVHSGVNKGERRQRLKDYKAGKYTCIVNNGILTTGFNHKPIDFMIMLRKTMSASLWIQMLGRGTRPWYADGYDLTTVEGRWAAIQANGKLNFRVMDFVGNIERLGPINDPVKPKKPGEKKNNDAPIRICPQDKTDPTGKVGCGMHNHPSLKECFYCDFIFPLPEAVTAVASTAEIVREKKADGPLVEKFQIDKVLYSANFHGKAPNIMVTYHCGKKKFKEWVCLEHSGYPRRKAEQWWKERAPDPLAPVPEFINEGLQQIESLKTPRILLVWTNKKPQEVMGYEY
jgi:DNA repair protein RadD